MARRSSCANAVFWALLMASPSALQLGASEGPLPHVNDCSMCMKCVVDEPPGKPVHPAALKASDFMPTDVDEKQKKPMCQECRGCTTQLMPLKHTGKKFIFGREFEDEVGASPNWLFVAPTELTEEKRAIVKVSCVPVSKHGAPVHPRCFSEVTARFAKLYLATERLAEECGLMDIVPKVWVAPVSGIIPDVGYHIRWHAIWMEQAEGISLENLVRLGKPMMHPQDLVDFLHDKVNKTRVVHAAIFDLLTSQCDRHAQNLFVNDNGHITLIDNERAFFENGHCGVDSILLPTTKKFAINVIENAWINKFKDWGTKIPQCWANVALLFDYRCYVEGGNIGMNLPPEVKQCVARIAAMRPKDIEEEFGFPTPETAMALYNRSKAMHEYGFEYALTFGWPRNPNPWRYKFSPPCCKIKHTDTYRCAHDWACDTSIPFGDPIGGTPWRRDMPDPGSYEGGSVF